MSEVRLDLNALGVSSEHMQSADVCGPSSSNAIPGVMPRKLIGETAGKIVRLANIYRVPSAHRSRFTKDINPRLCVILHADFVKLELIP
jgi:hypothetical protein